MISVQPVTTVDDVLASFFELGLVTPANVPAKYCRWCDERQPWTFAFARRGCRKVVRMCVVCKAV